MNSVFPEGAETLVPDGRAGLSPADAVERKLVTALRGASLRGSHLRAAGSSPGDRRRARG